LVKVKYALIGITRNSGGLMAFYAVLKIDRGNSYRIDSNDNKKEVLAEQDVFKKFLAKFV